jgi:hypothetical protein
MEELMITKLTQQQVDEFETIFNNGDLIGDYIKHYVFINSEQSLQQAEVSNYRMYPLFNQYQHDRKNKTFVRVKDFMEFEIGGNESHF